MQFSGIPKFFTMEFLTSTNGLLKALVQDHRVDLFESLVVTVLVIHTK